MIQIAKTNQIVNIQSCLFFCKKAKLMWTFLETTFGHFPSTDISLYLYKFWTKSHFIYIHLILLNYYLFPCVIFLTNSNHYTYSYSPIYFDRLSKMPSCLAAAYNLLLFNTIWQFIFFLFILGLLGTGLAQ